MKRDPHGAPALRHRQQIPAHNQGKGVLLIGGIKNVRRIEPMPGEIVQTRKYPDGLLQVFLGNERKPHHVLVEVATYSEKRALSLEEKNP